MVNLLRVEFSTECESSVTTSRNYQISTRLAHVVNINTIRKLTKTVRNGETRTIISMVLESLFVKEKRALPIGNVMSTS